MHKPGILTVYYGPMKSGKSETMLHELRRADIYAGRTFKLFRPSGSDRNKDISDRLFEQEFQWHDLPVENPESIFAFDYFADNPRIIAFDEAQFFGGDFVMVVQTLLHNSYDVCAAGLNLDFRGMPFGSMPNLIAMADIKLKLQAWCDVKGCCNQADMTQRLVDGMPARWGDLLHVVGDKYGKHDSTISYEARCKEHHIIPDAPLYEVLREDCL